MGSFNTACFASGQVIATGDKAFVMPILQASGYDPVKMTYEGKRYSMPGIACMSCYPHSFWEPFGAFIEAEYDDYGRFTLVDTRDNRVRLTDFLLTLYSRAAKVSKGENECHDVPFNLPKLVEKKAPILFAGINHGPARLVKDNEGSGKFFTELETLWEAIWEVGAEHRLFAANYRDELRPVQLAVMHAEAYKRLLADRESRQRPVFDKVMAAANAWLADQKAKLPPGDMDPDDADDLRHMTFWTMSSRITSGLERLGSFEGMEYHGEVELLDAAIAAYCAGTLDIEGLFAAVKPALDARCVMLGLNSMNLRLTPQIYAGQDYSNEAGRDYAKFVKAVSKTVTKQRKKRFGDDEDEEGEDE